MKQNQHWLIIGGGLSGLTLAYYLSRDHIETTVLEASSRLGGRIQTLIGERETPLELGATWFTEQHTEVHSLLRILELEYFPQFTTGISFFERSKFYTPQEFQIPESESHSFRISGGTSTLIHAMVNKLDATKIHLNTRVTSIYEKEAQLIVSTESQIDFIADKVILCLPPQLIGSSIDFNPPLPDKVTSLLPSVQTWMSGSIKFVLEYNTPFWRKEGYSGLVYSNVGLVTEMYDHSNKAFSKFGFTGFLHPNAIQYTDAQRKEQVLLQLHKLFGERILNPLTYSDKIWVDDYILGNNPIIRQAHLNNGDPVLNQGYFNDKLFFSNTETNAEFPGYMEGALRAAKSTYKRLRS